MSRTLKIDQVSGALNGIPGVTADTVILEWKSGNL